MFGKNVLITALLLVLIVVVGVSGFAEIPTSPAYWAKTYGGIGLDRISKVKLCSDGEYIVAGLSSSGAGGSDAWIVKLTSTGAVSWQKAYGGIGGEQILSIEECADGGYIAAGETGFGTGGGDGWILKLTSTGAVSWQKAIGGSRYDYLNSVYPCSDGSFIAAGSTYSTGTGQADAWVVKFTASGSIAWQKSFGGVGGDGQDHARAIKECPDGGYVVVGYTNAGSAWLLKLSSAGNILVQKSYYNFNGSRSASFCDVKVCSDNSIIVAGDTNVPYVGNSIAEVLKLAADGTVLWQKAYGNNNYGPAYCIQTCSDNGFILGINTTALGAGGTDFWLIKITASGAISWQKTYGGAASDYNYSGDFISECADGGFIFAGNTLSYGAGNEDGWIVKTDPDGNCPNLSADTSAAVSNTTCAVANINFTVTDTALPVIDTACTITVTNCSIQQQAMAHIPPIADAGSDQTVHVGTIITLDGNESSDPDNNYPLTYSWSIVQKPENSQATIENSDQAHASMLIDAMGNYKVQLVVTDSMGLTSASEEAIISTINSAPIANAGEDEVCINIGTIVELNGSQSWDQDGDPITYEWFITQKPENSSIILTNPASVNPTFIPDVYGDYKFKLFVIDYWKGCSTDEVTISFSNIKPIASAGNNSSCIVNEMISLNGSGSFDPNGDAITYDWQIVSKPSGSLCSLDYNDIVNPTLIPDLSGEYTISLVVNDGSLNSEATNVSIVAIGYQDAVMQKLQQAISLVNGLPLIAIKNTSVVNTLTNKLNAVILKVASGEYQGAYNQLANDITDKLNGCVSEGAPDKNDWIITCEAQGQVYPIVQEAIVLLEGLY